MVSSESSSLTKEIGCMTLRLHFRSILTFTLTCIQCFFVSFDAESPRTSPEMVLLGEFVQERDLVSVQEEDFLLPCVQKCFEPG